MFNRSKKHRGGGADRTRPRYGRRLGVETLEVRALLAADLIVEDVWTVPSTVVQGESFYIRARIRNQGNETANAGLFANQEVTFFLNGTRYGEGDDYDGLDPGETLVTRSINITAPSAGTHSIRAFADGNDEVDENNENNNTRTESITVQPPPAPDLVVDDIWLDPATVYVGDSFIIRATVRNQGNANANAGLFANQEATFFLNGEQFGEGDDYDNLGAGEELDVRSISLEATGAGSVSVRVAADGNGEVSESNESNNSRTETFTFYDHLSWRSGPGRDDPKVTSIRAGETVWAVVDGVADPGETIAVPVYEDDTEGLFDLLGDDFIESLSVTIGSNGIGAVEWAAPWQGDDADTPNNRYFLSYDAGLLSAEINSETLRTFVGTGSGSSFTSRLAYDWGGNPPIEGTIDATIERFDSPVAIDPAATTWLIIHGRNGSFDPANTNDETDENRMLQLAEAVDAATGDHQVLTLDWRDGAQALFNDLFETFDFSGEGWLETVGRWATEALTGMGFTTDNLNVIGHSWGGVVTGELAGSFPGGVNRVVAIDPAEDAPPPLGKFYSTENVVFGGDHSGHSWAFYSRDGGTLGITSGSDVSTATADEAFVVTGSEHSRVVDLFRLMLTDPTGPVSRFFSLDRLLAGTPGPWVTDRYDEEGAVDTADGLFEAVVSSTGLISRPTGVAYGSNGTTVPGVGDYNGDGLVNAIDYTVWRDLNETEVAPFSAADADGSGRVNATDLAAWRANYGATYSVALSQLTEPIGEVTEEASGDTAREAALASLGAEADRATARTRFERLVDRHGAQATSRGATLRREALLLLYGRGAPASVGLPDWALDHADREGAGPVVETAGPSVTAAVASRTALARVARSRS